MSKTAEGTVQTTLADLPTAETAEEAETDAQSDDSPETTAASDLEAIADDVGTTTAHQRERGDPGVDDGHHDGTDQEELRVRAETVAGRSAGYHRRSSR